MSIRQYLMIKYANIAGGPALVGSIAAPSGSSDISIDTGKGTFNGLDNMLSSPSTPSTPEPSSTPADSSSKSLSTATPEPANTDNDNWGNYDTNAINNAADNLMNNYDDTVAGWSNNTSKGLSSAIDDAYGDFNVDDKGNFKYSPVDWGDTDPNQDVLSEMNSGVEYGPGYKGDTNEDGYKTEVGELDNPVSSEASNTTQQASMAQTQPQRPSYQQYNQNRKELQAWDDHYNAIKQNIMTPSQVQRWRANGFTDEQMNAYADREARKQATNRYGDRPNDLMEEYNYNMAGYNNQQSPMQQFGAQPMSREQMMSAQNQQQPTKPQPRGMTGLRMRKPNSDPNRLREGNPQYDATVANLQKRIDAMNKRIEAGAGPFNKGRNNLISNRKKQMAERMLYAIQQDGLNPDGSYNDRGLNMPAGYFK